MLCNRCEHVLKRCAKATTAKQYPHHGTSKSFKEAIAAGCFVCRALASEINDVERRLDDTTSSSSVSPSSSSVPGRRSIILSWVVDQKILHYRNIHLVPLSDPKINAILPVSLAGDNIPSKSPWKTIKKLFGKLRTLQTDTGSAPHRSLDLAQKWIQDCQESHPNCKRINAWKTNGAHYQPKRLVDVGERDEQEWRLILSEDTKIGDRQYTTLSHRWSPNQQFRLTESNIKDFQLGQRVARLPKGFQEAIWVTRRLGIRYIWIDCLCIIQDSTTDWETESLVICRVYSHSAVNISATGSLDNTFGFLDVLKSPLSLPPRIESSWTSSAKDAWQVIDPFFWWTEVTKTTLMSRGWVFQERYLAPRVLHFGERQVLWECASLDACETFPDGLPQVTQSRGHTGFKKVEAFQTLTVEDGLRGPLDESRSSYAEMSTTSDLLLHAWCNAVEAYTRSTLTKSDDKLIAVGGVSEIFCRLYNKSLSSSSDYFAGIFLYHALPMLEWHAHSPLHAGHEFETSGSRTSTYRAPSWSWASIDGRVYYEFLPRVLHRENARDRRPATWLNFLKITKVPFVHLGWKPLVSNLEAKVEATAGSVFGQISDGYLRARGCIVRIETIMDSKLPTIIFKDPPFDDTQAFQTSCCLPLRCIDLITADGERSCWITGLVLDCLDPLQHIYRRSGLFCIPSMVGVQALNIQVAANFERVQYSNDAMITLVKVI